MRFSPNGQWLVLASGGQLTIIDTGGNVVVALGSGRDPIWSPLGKELLYATMTGGTPSVVVWDSDTGQTIPITSTAGGAGPAADAPVGWIERSLYYLRGFPNQPGRIELHRADWNGQNDQVAWSAKGVAPVGERPVVTKVGILIATDAKWLLIGADGSLSDAGANPYGAVGEPVASPGGSPIAYAAGDQVIVARADAPGVPIGQPIPYPGGAAAGFAWAPSGEQLVVTDGASLHVYNNDGTPVGTASRASGAPIAAPGWTEEGILFVDLAGKPTLKRIAPAAFSA